MSVHEIEFHIPGSNRVEGPGWTFSTQLNTTNNNNSNIVTTASHNHPTKQPIDNRSNIIAFVAHWQVNYYYYYFYNYYCHRYTNTLEQYNMFRSCRHPNLELHCYTRRQINAKANWQLFSGWSLWAQWKVQVSPCTLCAANTVYKCERDIVTKRVRLRPT